MKVHSSIPSTDILGDPIDVGDKVTVFSKAGIAYKSATVVLKDWNQDLDDNGEEKTVQRKAILVEGSMWIFGLGNQEILKEQN